MPPKKSVRRTTTAAAKKRQTSVVASDPDPKTREELEREKLYLAGLRPNLDDLTRVAQLVDWTDAERLLGKILYEQFGRVLEQKFAKFEESQSKIKDYIAEKFDHLQVSFANTHILLNTLFQLPGTPKRDPKLVLQEKIQHFKTLCLMPEAEETGEASKEKRHKSSIVGNLSRMMGKLAIDKSGGVNPEEHNSDDDSPFKEKLSLLEDEVDLESDAEKDDDEEEDTPKAPKSSKHRQMITSMGPTPKIVEMVEFSSDEEDPEDVNSDDEFQSAKDKSTKSTMISNHENTPHPSKKTSSHKGTPHPMKKTFSQKGTPYPTKKTSSLKGTPHPAKRTPEPEKIGSVAQVSVQTVMYRFQGEQRGSSAGRLQHR